MFKFFISFIIDIQNYNDKLFEAKMPGVSENLLPKVPTVTNSEALLLKDTSFAFVLFGTAHFQTDDAIKSKRLEQSLKILEKLLKSEFDTR